MSQLKTLASFTILLFLYSTSFGQKSATYHVDSSLHILTQGGDNYAYKCKAVRKDSLFYVEFFDRYTKLLRISAYFSDSLLTDLNGSFTRYHYDGKLASKENYSHGNKTGVWESWDKDGNKTDSTIYFNNERTAFANYYYYKTPEDKSMLYLYQCTDSLKNTFSQVIYSKENIISSEAYFVGERGIEKIYDNDKTTTDSVYTREQKEAEFPGGNMSWSRYLQKALGIFNPADKGAGNGTYKVLIKFVIDANGSISDVNAETNFGYGMEQKGIEVVKNGPNWIPALRFGRPVKAYRRQPFTFFVEGK